MMGYLVHLKTNPCGLCWDLFYSNEIIIKWIKGQDPATLLSENHVVIIVVSKTFALDRAAHVGKLMQRRCSTGINSAKWKIVWGPVFIKSKTNLLN